jgi:hypothetical protein
MKMTMLGKVLAGSLAASLCACGAGEAEPGAGGDAVDDLALEIAEAEAEWSALEADNEACFEGFRMCREGLPRGSEAARTCREELRACLPDRPGHPGRLRPDGGAGPRGHHGRGEGPVRIGRPHRGDGGAGPGPRHGRRPELAACREALHTCLEADTARDVCVGEARACVRKALSEAFEAICADARARCAEAGAPVEKCARIEARCAAGFPGAMP